MLPVFQPPFPSVYVPPSRTSVTCRARSPHPSNSSISRRTLLAHLLALPLIPAATALPNPNVLDPETGEYEPPELNFHSPLWPTPAETATTTEYLRATQQAPNDDIRHTARIYLARGGVVAFGAAISSIIMSIVERKAPRTPLPSKYDPYILEVYFRMRPDMVIRRCTLFAWEMLSLSFSYALLMLPFASGSESDRRSAWARELREAITRLGPAVIKLGQAAAARPDLFGAPIVRELQMLQDGIVESFSTRDACEVMDEELGAGPEKLFDWFEIMPVAGASLGMVFRASVDDNVVAVKVQRPGVAESVALDCYIVRALASIGTKLLGSRTDFRLAVDEYASRLFEELDYSNELRNIEQFRSLYGDMEGIYLPRVFPQYCSRKVLVTEWVEGVKLIDDDARVRAEDLGLVKTGIRFALTQLLDKGFMHAGTLNSVSHPSPHRCLSLSVSKYEIMSILLRMRCDCGAQTCIMATVSYIQVPILHA